MDLRLEYSKARLGRLVAIGLVMIGLCLWIGLDESAVGESDGVIGGRIARAIGPDGVRLAALAVALILALLLAAYLRLLLSGDSLAVGADRERLVLRSVLGDGAWLWRDVEALFVRRVSGPASQQMLIMMRSRDGREKGVACNGLRETPEEVEAWVEAAEDLRRVAIGEIA